MASSEDYIIPSYYETFNTISQVVEPLLATMSLLANTMIPIPFARCRLLRKRSSDVLLVFLATGDLLHVVVSVPITVLVMYGYPHNFYGCLFVVCTSTLPLGLPLTTWPLLVIALERFVAIRFPFKHAQYSSRSRMIKLVVLFWSVGAGFIFLPMLGWNLGWINNGECSFHLLVDSQFRIFAIFVPSSLSPLLAMSAIYVYIFCVVMKTTRAVGPQPAAPDAAPDNRRTALVAAKKCGVIILAYVVFIMPIDMVICAHYFLGYQCLLCVRGASWGILCHGFICPTIYLYQNKLLRNVVCLTLRRLRIDEHELSLAHGNVVLY